MPSISAKAQQMPASPIRKLIPYAEKAKKEGKKNEATTQNQRRSFARSIGRSLARSLARTFRLGLDPSRRPLVAVEEVLRTHAHTTQLPQCAALYDRARCNPW